MFQNQTDTQKACKYTYVDCSSDIAYYHYLDYTLYMYISLVVVENLWDKSSHSNILSFSESVHPLVPQKKSLHDLLLGKSF